MNNKTKILAKLALSQVKMAQKTLAKIVLPPDRDKNTQTDALAFAKFHNGVSRSYLESSLGHEKGND